MFFFKDLRSLASKGGIKAAISYKTQPNDQISHLEL